MSRENGKRIREGFKVKKNVEKYRIMCVYRGTCFNLMSEIVSFITYIIYVYISGRNSAIREYDTLSMYLCVYFLMTI